MVYGLIQYFVLSLALGYSLWQLWGKLAPRQRADKQQKLALMLMGPNWPRGANRLGFKLLPKVASSCGTGGCNACGVCEPV